MDTQLPHGKAERGPAPFQDPKDGGLLALGCSYSAAAGGLLHSNLLPFCFPPIPLLPCMRHCVAVLGCSGVSSAPALLVAG